MGSSTYSSRLPPPIDQTHGHAVVACRSCRAVFETGLQPDGSIRFDGIRLHGAQAHPDAAEWSYRVEERHPAGGA